MCVEKEKGDERERVVFVALRGRGGIAVLRGALIASERETDCMNQIGVFSPLMKGVLGDVVCMFLFSLDTVGEILLVPGGTLVTFSVPFHVIFMKSLFFPPRYQIDVAIPSCSNFREWDVPFPLYLANCPRSYAISNSSYFFPSASKQLSILSITARTFSSWSLCPTTCTPTGSPCISSAS